MSAPAPNAALTSATASRSKRTRTGGTTPSERRVQPRHFHAGPNPITSAAASASSGVDDVTISQTPVVRLYRHALESIFSFLSQGELALALRVSTSWLSAVKSMASLLLVQKVPPPNVPLHVIGGSAMGRHLTTLGGPQTPLCLNADSLFVLSLKMPHLRDLCCSLEAPASHTPLTFPSSLRKLNFFLSGSIIPGIGDVVLQSICRLPLLKTLIIDVGMDASQVSFAPLLAIQHHLMTLVLFQKPGDIELVDTQIGDMELTDSQIDILRSLSHLHKLSLSTTSMNTLRRLVRQPHNIQWREIKFNRHVDDVVAEFMSQLPSLTKLSTTTSCTDFQWMHRLSHLKHVNLSPILKQGNSHRGRIPTESLVTALGYCSKIENLCLSHWNQLTSAHLMELLPRLQQLRALTLGHLEIDSLAFLSHPTIAGRLDTLMLVECKRLPVTELHHVHALRVLYALIVNQCFISSLDAYSQSLYTPPSILLPKLGHFSYTV